MRAHPPFNGVNVMGCVEMVEVCLTFFCSCFQFVVVRFHETEEDDSQYFEVALSSWIAGELDDEMNGMIHWPPEKKPATPLIKLQTPADPSWDLHNIQVMRFYATFVQARAAVPKFLKDSTYETEVEMQPKKRSRIRPSRFLESSSDSDDDLPVVRKRKADIPAPPSINCTTAKPSQQKSKIGKGQALTKEESRKKEKEELMARLKAARAAAAAKMTRKSPRKHSSPWKITPEPEASISNTQALSPQKTSALSPSSPFKSGEGYDPNMLEVQIHEGGSGSNDTELVTPVCSPGTTPVTTPVGSPNKANDLSFSSLPRSNAFCFSPASAAEFTKRLKSKKSSVSQNKEVEGTNSSSDGRRNLFTANKKSSAITPTLVEERLQRLEVLAAEISSKADIILMNVGRLQRSLLPSEKRITAPPNMPKLPLEDKDQLAKFETFLGSSDVNLSAVCDYLSSFIRSAVPDPERKSAQSILSRLLCNRLAEEMNLEGRNNKVGFRGLNLYKVFLGTLQTAFPKSDLSTAEDALQKWLKDAKWRKPKHISTVSLQCKSSKNNTPAAS